MPSRELATGAALAEQIASALSGRAHMIARGDWPVAFITVGDRAPLVFADQGSNVRLELPDGPSWSLATRADLAAFLPEVRAALASYFAIEPRPIALGDVAVAIFDTLERMAGAPWSVSLGRPTASGLDLECQMYRVRLRREGPSIRVEVFMAGGRERPPTLVDTAHALASIADVVQRQLESVGAEIAVMLAQREADAKLRRARTNESFDAVIAALHGGARFEICGPRWSETYFVEAGQLCCRTFDEGFESVRNVDDETLRDAMDRRPESFAATRVDRG